MTTTEKHLTNIMKYIVCLNDKVMGKMKNATHHTFRDAHDYAEGMLNFSLRLIPDEPFEIKGNVIEIKTTTTK